jgi:hypothetical protein
MMEKRLRMTVIGNWGRTEAMILRVKEKKKRESKKRLCLWETIPLVFLWLAIMCNPNLLAEAKMQHSPAEVKAQILFAIVPFVDWPVGSGVEDTSKPFIISVIGENPFEHYLDAKLSKKIKNKTLGIRYIKKAEDIGATNLLFIGEMGHQELQRIVDQVRDKPILTVGNTEGYWKRGVHINLLDDRTIKMEINEMATRQAGIKLSPSILSTKNVAIVNPYNEYKEKAEHLKQIARSVQWPLEAGIDQAGVFTISILGVNPFGKFLTTVCEDIKVANKNVVIRIISSVEGASGSQLLFITKAKSIDLTNILAFTRNKPILTVSDASGLTREGVHVSFTFEGVKLREEVNPVAAREVGLVIGGDLLRDGIKIRSRSQN